MRAVLGRVLERRRLRRLGIHPEAWSYVPPIAGKPYSQDGLDWARQERQCRGPGAGVCWPPCYRQGVWRRTRSRGVEWRCHEHRDA